MVRRGRGEEQCGIRNAKCVVGVARRRMGRGANLSFVGDSGARGLGEIAGVFCMWHGYRENRPGVCGTRCDKTAREAKPPAILA